MYNIDPNIRLKAVEHYLQNNSSLKRTADKFNIHHMSLYKWLSLYKKEGETRLLATYKKPWNKLKKKYEERIVYFKERDPTLTLRKARQLLAQNGIRISIKGIWGVWKRYGYAGFRKDKLCPDFTEYCSWSKEAVHKFRQASELFKCGRQDAAAEILNSVPVLPRNDLLVKIPDSLLNLRRRVEKMASSYRTTPLREYFDTIKSLHQECINKNLNHLAMRVKIFEVGALSFTGEPKKQLKSTEELKKSLRRKGDYFSSLLFSLKFPLLVSEGIASAQLSEIKKASRISRYCCTLIKRRKNISESFIHDLGSLCTWTEDFKKAEYCFSRVYDRTEEEARDAHIKNLGFLNFHKGNYRRAIAILKSVKKRGWGHDSKVLMCEAMWSLVKGLPDQAIALSTKALTLSRKNELNIGLIMAYSRIASAYCALGMNTKALAILRRLLPFAKKNFKRVSDVLEHIVSLTPKHQTINTPSENLLPTAKLVRLLKCGRYKEALSFTKRKYLMTYFHQYILFFPDIVNKMLERGRPTHLPRSMLRLPIFNKKIPVYHIKFLGPLILHKNDRYHKVKLPPRDSAFAIQLSLRAGEPGRKIILSELYSNFWKNSLHPARNLSHLLVQLKKSLRIPGHLLAVSKKGYEATLNNRGIHFLTDYDEFKQMLATARAFERAGEWDLARKDYLRAFALFRGEPFKNMYDGWSEDIRRVILNTLEENAVHFVKVSLNHSKTNDAKKVLTRVSRIIPQSVQIEEIIEKSLKVI